MIFGKKVLWAWRDHTDRPEWKIMKQTPLLKEENLGLYACPFCEPGSLLAKLGHECFVCGAKVCEIYKNPEYYKE